MRADLLAGNPQPAESPGNYRDAEFDIGPTGLDENIAMMATASWLAWDQAQERRSTVAHWLPGSMEMRVQAAKLERDALQLTDLDTDYQWDRTPQSEADCASCDQADTCESSTVKVKLSGLAEDVFG